MLNMTSDSDTAASKQRRTWRRFSLRSFLFVTTIVCIWMGVVLNRVLHQKRAADAIEAVGGQITYDWQIRPEESDSTEPMVPPGLSWLRERLGPDWFDNIEFVFLDDSDDSRDSRFATIGPHLLELKSLRAINLRGDQRELEDYKMLGQFSQLEKLWLNQKTEYTPEQIRLLPKNLRELHIDGLMSPDAFRALAKLPKLTVFELVCRINGTMVTGADKTKWPGDEDAEALSTISQLKSVELYHTHFTNNAMARLCEMKNLESIKIGSSEMTGEALVYVSRLKKLSQFGALHWAIQDEELRHLSQFPDLQRLDLVTYGITDAGVPYVAKFRNLTWLRLRGHGISDQSVQHLLGLSKLKHLDLSSTSVAKHGAAVKQLKTALPKCKILLPRTQAEINAHKQWIDSKFGN